MSKTWKDAFKSHWAEGDSFNCSQQELTSLEGAPSHVKGSFDCSFNELTSLYGAPSRVDGDFYCSYNNLTSLNGIPSYIGGLFHCRECGLTSLKDIHLQIKHIGMRANFTHNPIKSHVLGLLLIEGLSAAWLVTTEVEKIINKHLPSKGMESVLLCQEELILAGFEEYAQL